MKTFEEFVKGVGYAGEASIAYELYRLNDFLREKGEGVWMKCDNPGCDGPDLPVLPTCTFCKQLLGREDNP